MALLTSEVQRIKYELGYNQLTVNAEPYVGVTALFEQVIQPYMNSGASTTSSTAVVAPSAPAPFTLTLASATGFTAGDRVVVDVDSRQEIATIQSISGAAVTVLLSKAHSGTYPVSVEGGESIVRGILAKLRVIADLAAGGGDMLSAAASTTGIKKVDEIEFFGGGNSMMSGGTNRVDELKKLREYWRDELSCALGVPRLNASSGCSISVY